MYHNRLIPCLLLKNHGLVKTIQFKNGRYLGDPINAVKIFNDREVDELFVLDIDATPKRKSPDYEYLRKITQQCFMPAGYGGGITNIDDVKTLFEIGFEKIAVNTAAYTEPEIITKAANIFGSQSIVGVIDVMSNQDSWDVYVNNGRERVSSDVQKYAKRLVELGVGELFINSIDRDGMMNGFDLNLITSISNEVGVPIVACGGAGNLQDCARAVEAGASAVAAGSMFVYWGRKRAVLINYPDSNEIIL